MFLTHRDDVADHAKFAKRFGCTRVLHAADVSADTRAVEMTIDGDEPTYLDRDLLAIPVPGHTRGSTALLFRDFALFSGDHLFASESGDELHAYRSVCWWSWEAQKRSLEKLLAFDFEWILPGHQGRMRAPSREAMREQVRAAIDRRAAGTLTRWTTPRWATASVRREKTARSAEGPRGSAARYRWARGTRRARRRAGPPSTPGSDWARRESVSYLVLARKYRPQSFDDLIGQEHVAQTLANAIAQDRVAHAFLFTGVRGVGKTTSARILAKCLNCLGADGKATGPTSKPCQSCAACTEIAAGVDMDVQEIDGASYNGVDEVRRLQEGLAFRPARDRFKIYIVDEVHMLSNAAWNAFLKTLEEPPPHVKFIFATTEVHKVPVTILSRCQRYDFKLVSARRDRRTPEGRRLARDPRSRRRRGERARA